jgi:hypothetical protein
MATVQEALERIWNDPEFKRKLLANPKPVLTELGLDIPAGTDIRIHENSAGEMNFVLPEKAELGGADPEEGNAVIGRVMKKAWSDPAFKKRLLADPKPAIADAAGVELPAALKVRVHENTATVKNLVLPVNPKSEELSDSDLEAVAGGGMSKGAQTALGCGIGSALASPFGGGGAVGVASKVGGAIASGRSKC